MKLNKEGVIIKYNGGVGAVICSGCSMMLKTGHSFTEEEWKCMRGEIHLDPYYCEECLEKKKKEAL